MNTKMLKPKDAAKILDVSEKTLANKCHLGIGPPFFKDGGVIRYPSDGRATYINKKITGQNYE